ncbi:proline-rich protein PRCC isoform X2 [Ambystoma mexicanum]|uniref:proline-rich protein PRCC isoform X2 n=1 Tax=Ambystoma mexicanum TaxID=8296 RepID=UPI0037E949D9
MSLVAYASSDDSDSETEPPGSPPVLVQQRGGGLFASLPPPKSTLAPSPSLVVPTEPSFLPAPHRTVSPSLPEAPIVEVRLALPPPKRSGLSLPAPTGDITSHPGAKKRTEPVRISAPQLQRNDSDSEEDEPAKKKKNFHRGAAEGSGLSALLPQPKNLAGKESKRQLLPYTFTKKAAESSSDEKPAKKALSSKPKPISKSEVVTAPSPSLIKAAAKCASLQIARQIAQEEEDSDEEVKHGNFFSLSENSDPPVVRTEPFLYTATIVTDSSSLERNPVQLSDNSANAPLEFKSESEECPDTPPPPGTSDVWEPKPGEEIHSQPYSRYNEYSGSSVAPAAGGASYYEEYYTAGYYPESDQAAASPTESNEEPSSFIDDEAFKRLQGKRNRGREEINFLEIKGDDQLSGNQQWLTKSLTEEKNMKSFSKKKGDQPTGQQRRKHQITYLIHQAKERELELKNAWSENKLSRRQTQAKYGF